MNRNHFFMFLKQCATLGRIGYLPIPGTMASLVTMPAVILLHTLVPARITFYLLVACTALTVMVIEKVLQLMARPAHVSAEHFDPREIVLDEVVACFWVFYGVTLTPQKLVIGFVLFRLLDGIKPAGIHWLERLPGAWGVMADDLLAAFYTGLVLQFV